MLNQLQEEVDTATTKLQLLAALPAHKTSALTTDHQELEFLNLETQSELNKEILHLLEEATLLTLVSWEAT